MVKYRPNHVYNTYSQEYWHYISLPALSNNKVIALYGKQFSEAGNGSKTVIRLNPVFSFIIKNKM